MGDRVQRNRYGGGKLFMINGSIRGVLEISATSMGIVQHQKWLNSPQLSLLSQGPQRLGSSAKSNLKPVTLELSWKY
ncbi:hypothetical protein Leryth_022419 [Lithospermum erythrorhizon]|nr:hypothetical protein Leryth_022419 [Lithospermum erythrorhizon]